MKSRINKKSTIVAPSILSADFANLGADIKKVEEAGADWIHVDVMDGAFVPNITIGAPVVQSIRKVTQIPLDVHLMINNPQNFIKDFAKAGSDIITVHFEACEDNILEVINEIKSYGIKAGVSIKPNTPVEKIENIMSELDLVLIMTVEPGFGGQKFIEYCGEKISQVKDILEKKNLHDVIIEVDGGINFETAKVAIEAGVNALVAGSYVYGSDDIKATIASLKAI